MKKIVVLMLALCLAVPAISYAGNATSRFDLNIGGTVRFDMGWADYSNGPLGEGGLPAREGKPEGVALKYGNWLWGAGQSALNFAVRGPDAWGAKTSAFLLMDFVTFFGIANPPNAYGTPELMIATMTFDWPNTSLMIGQAGSVFGMIPVWGENVSWSGNPYGGKGAAPVVPQITVTQRFAKAFAAQFGIATQDQFVQKNAAFGGNEFTRSDYPFVQGGLSWSSPACGKVGPWQLTFGVTGGWGQDKYVRETTANDREQKVDKYWAEFKYLVPIIPEKNGNKAGALYWAGQVFTQQGMGAWLGGLHGPAGSIGVGRYARDNGDITANQAAGTFQQADFYFTDQFYVALQYYYVRIGGSKHRADTTFFPSMADKTQGFAAIFQYNVNPAIKFSFQYDREWTNFRLADPGFRKTASHNGYRFAAYYFF